jgi:PTH1 family peptidyl-tRNA hydrolase
VKLVVGLGNPGPRYAGSRHNVGFRVVEALAHTQGLAIREVRFSGLFVEGVMPGLSAADPGGVPERLGLLLPETFMNDSGASVGAAVAALPVAPANDLLLVYDDLDLPLGRLRVRPRGGAGGHRGVQSVIDALDSSDFARLRFGIGRPAPEVHSSRDELVDFVLEGFSVAEQDLMAERIPLAVEAALTTLREGPVAAMDRFNAVSDPGPSDEEA